MKLLDAKLKTFMTSDCYKSCQRQSIDYGDIIYTAVEKGVTYMGLKDAV